MARREGARLGSPPPRTNASAPPLDRRFVLAGVALIAVVTAVVYMPSLGGGFILDDDLYLTDNRLVAASDGLYRIWFTTQSIDYYPFSNSTLWIEWRLWGTQPTGYRITNLVLHVAGALLIWAVLRKLSVAGAFLAALLFAVHPVNVESVAWIAQRKGLLAASFFLSSVLFYEKAEEPSRRTGGRQWYWLSVAAFVLAMLSKASAAILPPVLLLLAWWRRPLTERDVIRTAPFFLVGLALVAVNAWFHTRSLESRLLSAGFAERLLGAGAAVWFYLGKALLPLHLVLIYPQWSVRAEQLRWWLPLAAAVAVTVLLWWYRRGWSRSPLVAWGYFCLALVPILGFTNVGFMHHSLVADHYQHLALIGVVALVAAYWDTWRQRMRGGFRWMPYAAAAVLAGTLGFLTWRQSRVYADAVALYEATLQSNPDSWMAQTNLGILLLERGRRQEAIGRFENALRLNPDYPQAHNALGSELAESGRLAEAIEHFRRAAQLWPSFRAAHYNLALALALAGQHAEAVEHYERTLRLQPEFPAAHYNLGLALAQTGRLGEAGEHFRQALRHQPDYPEAYNNLATILAHTGHLEEAIGFYREALRLAPDYADAKTNLDEALAMQREEKAGASR